MTKRYDPVEYAKKKQRQRERALALREARRRFARRYLNRLFALESKDQRDNAARMQLYIMSERVTLPLADKMELLRDYLPSDAPFLAANNPEARLRFERILMHHVMTHGYGKTAHFVTLAPKQFAVPASLAENYDIFPLQQWVRQIMHGFSFIGMVEVAYYSSDGQGGKTASFHAHLIVFKANDFQLHRLKREVNEQHEAWIPSAHSMNVQSITDGTLGGVALYMGKESLTNYRAYDADRFVSKWTKKSKVEENDDSAVDRLVRQKKQPANPKTQLAIRKIMHGQHLDKLLFGGGACGGKEGLLGVIRRDLMRELPFSKRAQREVQYSGCFEGRRRLRDSENGWVRLGAGFNHAYFDEVAALAGVFGHPDYEETERERLGRTRRLKGLQQDFKALVAA